MPLRSKNPGEHARFDHPKTVLYFVCQTATPNSITGLFGGARDASKGRFRKAVIEREFEWYAKKETLTVANSYFQWKCVSVSGIMRQLQMGLTTERWKQVRLSENNSEPSFS